MTQSLIDDICIVTALKGMALSENESNIRSEAYARICAHGYDLVNRESLQRRRKQLESSLEMLNIEIESLDSPKE
jgi:hypothetical protein